MAAQGATESDLRWLLDRRYADQLEEISRRGHDERHFRVVSGLTLIDKSCFVLTYGGKTFTENRLDGVAPARHRGAPTTRLPRERICWDCLRHELRVDGGLVKRFLHKAEAQWTALDTFEADGWRGPIAIDPGGDPSRDPSQRLRELVAELNTNLDTSMIHFRKDPAGNCITFDLP